MNDFLDELARMEVEPDEVREILRRFATEEFQTSSRATVLDLAEATGTAPETVVRVLAELRGKPWEQWKGEIEASMRDHAARIQTLEANRHATAPNSSEVKRVAVSVEEHARRLKALESIRNSTPLVESDVQLYERVERGPRDRNATGTAMGIFFAFVVIGLFLSATARQAPLYPADQWYPGLTRIGNAGSPMYGYNGQCVWSEEMSNGRPGPITNRAAADQALKQASMSEGGRSCPP